MTALRVLITNAFLSGRSGTEIVTRDIALGLQRRGHTPIVYAPELGPLADELRTASVPVIDRIGALTVRPDVIHAHHNPSAAIAIARFPDVPAIFVCHGFASWPETPPLFPSIVQYVADDLAVAERLSLASGISADRVVVHLNAVDLRRFAGRRQPLPPYPARALAYVKHTAHLGAIRAACAERGIALDVAGAVAGNRLDVPEDVLPQYDLVFSSALSALEAMASGCATIVCDARGLAGMVTPATFALWRPYNFGVRTLLRQIAPEALGEEIDRYDSAAAAAVTALIRHHAGIDQLVEAYIALYRSCVKPGIAWEREAHDRAVAEHLETWRPRYDVKWPWSIDRLRMLDDLDAALNRPPHLRVGERVATGTGSPAFIEYVTGFTFDDFGRWTEGERAVMVVRVEPRDGPIDLALLVDAFVREEHPSLVVDVRVNGTETANWSFRHPALPDWRSLRVDVTPAGRGVVVVEFAIRTPRSPRELGLSDDGRRLGLALHQLEVRVSNEGAPAS